MRIWPLMWLLSLSSCANENAEGVVLFDAGMPRQALQKFRLAERRVGHAASTDLLYNRAVAALAAQELLDAEATAERLAVRGGLALFGTRDFLRGLAAYQRASWATEESKQPEADPTALPQALLYAKAAIRHFRMACKRKTDWPKARRNLERCLLLLDGIEKQRDEALKQQKRKRENERSNAAENAKGEAQEQKIQAQNAPLEFTRDEMRRIFARLREKEEEKQEVRRAMQLRRRLKVEKDW